ncbi:MAG: hypothetical protein KGR26_08690, partial [Cyanobacteria bacterium REEB65]|nr:hypothetical protein [Cyanobacteria bacterium REEB65]
MEVRAGIGYGVAVGMWAIAVPLLGVTEPAFAAPHRPFTAHLADVQVRPSIGSVDVQRLQDEYVRAQDLQNQYQADEEKYEADLQEGQKRIEALQGEIASEDAAVKAATSDVAIANKHREARDTAQ